MRNRPPARWVGNILGIIIAVYLALALGGTVEKNYSLDKQITSMQQQITQLQSQKAQLNFDLQYYQTDSYRQREAKQSLGLVEPGETEIVLPPQPAAKTSRTTATAAPHKSNLQQWWDFLLGRTGS